MVFIKHGIPAAPLPRTKVAERIIYFYVREAMGATPGGLQRSIWTRQDYVKFIVSATLLKGT